MILAAALSFVLQAAPAEADRRVGWTDCATTSGDERVGCAAARAVRLEQSIARRNLDCEHAASTADMVDCALVQYARDSAEMERYYRAAQIEAVARDQDFTTAAARTLVASQEAWQAYVDAACQSVSEFWGGSFARVQIVMCASDLTRERTKDIWTSYLIDMDGAMVLPDPSVSATAEETVDPR